MSAPEAEPDRAPGAPHPRETVTLVGQGAAEATFLAAWASGRLPHAWLLQGPRGVGKATLAYRIARAVLADPAPRPTLDVAPDHPVAHRIAAGSEPRLRVARREVDPKTGRAQSQIAAPAVRAVNEFLNFAAVDGGWRAVIVDAIDDANRFSANALLKYTEEPPPRTLLLLVCQNPVAVLPTIRSRCRPLLLRPLGPEDFPRVMADAAPGELAALAALSGGAPGEAMRLAQAGGATLYRGLSAMLAAAPGAGREALAALADSVAGRDARGRYDAALELTVLLLQRLARVAAGAAAPEPALGEDALAARLTPGAPAARVWAEAAAAAAAGAARSRAVNLDPAATILDIWQGVDAAAAQGFAPARRA